MTNTAYPVEIITRDQIPEWEEKAAAAGRVLDHWYPVDGDDETVAARIVPEAERKRAIAARYLGLDLARR